MDNMYYGENDIRKKLKITHIVACFALGLSIGTFVSTHIIKPKNVEYAEVNIAFAPYSITSMLGGLDSLARHDVNDDMALLLMREIEVQHPHIVLAQMKLESGHYQSKLAKENNNYFGMKHPRQRLTMSMGEKNGYAHFRSWAHSILDYALWQKRYAYDLNEQEYLQKIGSVYAEDEEYIRKVKSLTKK